MSATALIWQNVNIFVKKMSRKCQTILFTDFAWNGKPVIGNAVNWARYVQKCL